MHFKRFRIKKMDHSSFIVSNKNRKTANTSIKGGDNRMLEDNKKEEGKHRKKRESKNRGTSSTQNLSFEENASIINDNVYEVTSEQEKEREEIDIEQRKKEDYLLS